MKHLFLLAFGLFCDVFVVNFAAFLPNGSWIGQ